MSEEPKKRPKRGRPAKIPEKRQRKKSDSPSSSDIPEYDIKQEKTKYHNRMLENYYELQSNFIRDGISQQSQHLIRKIIQGPEVPDLAKLQPLLLYLNTVTQEFLMNELEIVVLGIYLEKFIWQDKSTSIDLLIKYAAYAAKVYLAEDMNPIDAFLCHKYPGFIENFTVWKQGFKNFMSVNPKDLNDKFKELSKALVQPGNSKIMDYNYYVDEILQYNPTVVHDKPIIDELVNDSGCIELYNAIEDNKKIVNKDGQDVNLELIQKAKILFGDFSRQINVDERKEAFVVSSAVLKKIEMFNPDGIEEENEED